MPKRACCCNTPPDVGSCCRPIYNGCVGKEYEFTFRVTAKYPCYNYPFLTPAIYTFNDGITNYEIPGYQETFEIKVNYKIKKILNK